MQLRRALVAFAVVFVSVSLLAALAAPREKTDDRPAADAASRPGTPAIVEADFQHPAPKVPPVRTVRAGSHVLVRVRAGVVGDVEIVGLGLIQSVAPGTPAVFDLLASRADRFDVSLLAAGGERIELGTLVVEN